MKNTAFKKDKLGIYSFKNNIYLEQIDEILNLVLDEQGNVIKSVVDLYDKTDVQKKIIQLYNMKLSEKVNSNSSPYRYYFILGIEKRHLSSIVSNIEAKKLTIYFMRYVYESDRNHKLTKQLLADNYTLSNDLLQSFKSRKYIISIDIKETMRMVNLKHLLS